MTDDAALPGPLTRALADIPTGKSNAFLLGVTTDGAEIGFRARLEHSWEANDVHWTVEAEASYTPGEQVLADVKVKAAW